MKRFGIEWNNIKINVTKFNVVSKIKIFNLDY